MAETQAHIECVTKTAFDHHLDAFALCELLPRQHARDVELPKA
ncbi:hypothetical protein [Paraburkholderia sp. PGU19]|nr:hypothetical protein [Paraburkholderia sp. PGU19]